MRKATILHADLDAFFASVAQRDDPGLRGKPVIVGGGVVLAASYEARAFGIRSAMGGGGARELCPHAIVVKPRWEAYLEASRAVHRDLRGDRTAGRAAVDRRGVPRRARARAHLGHAAAHRRAAAARGARGRRAADSVGVARNKSLAKMASAAAKPDGLLVVAPERELEFLHPLPVERLWGVGPATAVKLHESGLTRWASSSAAESDARRAARAGARPARPRARPPARPAAGAAPGGGRGSFGRAERARARAPSRARRSTRSLLGAGRPRHAAHAREGAGRPHDRAAAALRRLLARHALADAAAVDRGDADGAQGGARSARGVAADDRAAGPDPRRHHGREPRPAGHGTQLELPLDGPAWTRSTPRWTRSGTASGPRR